MFTPIKRQELSRALRKLPRNTPLADDEILALVDTGSNIHAADADVHVPDCAPLVRRAPTQKSSHAATTADGHRLDNLGKFTISASANGQDIKIPFNHMKVKLPILSVRQMLSKGGRLGLTETSGCITNSRTRQRINFIVHDDLWYMKLKVQKPPSDNGCKPDTGFGRQGAR